MFYSPLLSKRLFVVLMAVFLTACSDAGNEANSEEATSEQSNLPVLHVYKSPTCGCCKKWITHLEDNGFQATAHNMNDLSALKRDKQIQPRYQSCHTAVSKDGYVFEGHIPARVIQKFLREKPEGVIGLSVPAMPMGSPGMEMGDHFTPYTVLLLKSDGSHSPYVEINSRKEQYQ